MDQKAIVDSPWNTNVSYHHADKMRHTHTVEQKQLLPWLWLFSAETLAILFCDEWGWSTGWLWRLCHRCL
jgi:hypothetical protein